MKLRTIPVLFIITTILIGPPASLADLPAVGATASFSIFGVPQNIGTTINTGGDENSPFVAPNGLSLYFSGQRDGTVGGGDIWVSQRPTLWSAWGPPQNLGTTINTVGNDNTPTLSADGRTMFFNSDRPDLGGLGGQDIYMTTRTDPTNDFAWTIPINLGPVINTPNNEGGAAYFEDPATGVATLYFLGIRPGGFGDQDIYQAIRNPGGGFLQPQNVVALNSASRDARPAIRRDGLEILFTSDRPGGAGGIDIYVSTRATTQSAWNPPVNLAALNTNTTDGAPAHSPDGSVIYFASTRTGGSGSSDLYTVARTSVNRAPAADFDGDARTDISVFRPSDGTWHMLASATNTYRMLPFGVSSDRIVPADYDGDGRTDVAIWRPTTGVWWIVRSSDGVLSTIVWGVSSDKPAPGDYDGDGRADIAVYRGGTWYIVQSSNGSIAYHQFGLDGDIPIAGGGD